MNITCRFNARIYSISACCVDEYLTEWVDAIADVWKPSLFSVFYQDQTGQYESKSPIDVHEPLPVREEDMLQPSYTSSHSNQVPQIVAVLISLEKRQDMPWPLSAPRLASHFRFSPLVSSLTNVA